MLRYSLGSTGSDSPALKALKAHSPQLSALPYPWHQLQERSVTRTQLLFLRRLTDRSVPWPVGVQMSKLITLPGDLAVGKGPEITQNDRLPACWGNVDGAERPEEPGPPTRVCPLAAPALGQAAS